MAWITLLTLVEVPALTLLRMGARPGPLPAHGRRAEGLDRMALAGLIFAFAVVPLLSIALQYEGIGIVNFFWNIQSTILMFAVGVFLFKEKVAPLQIVGVILSLLGMGLVVLSKE